MEQTPFGVNTGRCARSPWQLVRQGHIALRWRGAAAPTILGPGWHWCWPWLDRLERCDDRPRLIETQNQDVVTADGHGAWIDSCMTIALQDPLRFQASSVEPIQGLTCTLRSSVLRAACSLSATELVGMLKTVVTPVLIESLCATGLLLVDFNVLAVRLAALPSSVDPLSSALVATDAHFAHQAARWEHELIETPPEATLERGYAWRTALERLGRTLGTKLP